ncbi:MAG: hypothetical protein GF353_23740 [Candidatus Lokiarchaeota archaeon]|nr:hypothetical protein [Candidatus Lokiarchaeota archaeon]
MRNLISPDKIRKDFLEGRLTLSDAGILLLTLIEKSDDVAIREKAINLLSTFKLHSSKIFKTLENCLLSDESAIIRAAAARIIMKDFINEGMESLKWALKHDDSVLMVKTLRDLKLIIEE